MKHLIYRIYKIVFAYLLISSLYITFIGLAEEDNLKSDFALILGNKIEENGNPSDRLKARLDRALEIYNQNLIQYIIVSGGIGIEGFDEAKVMKEYLVQKGIPANSVIEDNLGYTTESSAKNLKSLTSNDSSKTILIISQYFHLPRSVFLVKKQGFSNVKSTFARYFELRDFYSIFRECIALPVYSIKAFIN
jgi:vancomycin permeability regulator SanA